MIQTVKVFVCIAAQELNIPAVEAIRASARAFQGESTKSSGGGHGLHDYTVFTWSNVTDVLCLIIRKEMQIFNVRIRPA